MSVWVTKDVCEVLTVGDESRGEATGGLVELLLVTLRWMINKVECEYRTGKTHSGQKDEVGVVLVLVDLGNQGRVSRGYLLGGRLDEVLGDISGVGIDLAVVGDEGRECASRVLQ